MILNLKLEGSSFDFLPAAEVRAAEGVEGRRGHLLRDHDGDWGRRHSRISRISWHARDRLLHHPREKALHRYMKGKINIYDLAAR